MIYCEKCSRLLNEDVDKCPYCGNDESNSTEETATDLNIDKAIKDSIETVNVEIAEPEITNSFDEKTTPITENMGFENNDTNTKPPVEIGTTQSEINSTPIVEPAKTGIPPNTQNIDNISQDLNQLFEGKTLKKETMGSAPTPNRPNMNINPKDPTVHKTTVVEEDKPLPTFVSVLLVISTIFMPIIGIIGGIVLMVSENKFHKKFGLILLVISIVVLILWIICCCFSSVFFGMLDYMY